MNARHVARTVARTVAPALIALAVGCGGAPQPRASTAPAAPAAPAAARAIFDPSWLVGGTWVARESDTPLGPIPFAFEFRREQDGSVHAHAGDDKKYVDLRFRRDPATQAVVLDEEGALPGVGTVGMTLTPTTVTRDASEWRVAGRPDYVVIQMTRTRAEAMSFVVLVHGKPHVRFALERVTGRPERGAGDATTAMQR